jgi:hypothetical protein
MYITEDTGKIYVDIASGPNVEDPEDKVYRIVLNANAADKLISVAYDDNGNPLESSFSISDATQLELRLDDLYGLVTDNGIDILNLSKDVDAINETIGSAGDGDVEDKNTIYALIERETARATTKEKEIEDAVPYVLWGDRPASNEYVYIYRTDVLTDEKLESFEKEHKAFVDGIDPDYKAVVITLLCVEKSSPAFESYLNRQPRMEDFRLCELVTGIAFDERLMHANILTNCPGEKNARDIRKEFLRMIRVAENYFKG